jgi:hypothetical protein
MSHGFQAKRSALRACLPVGVTSTTLSCVSITAFIFVRVSRLHPVHRGAL